MAQPYYKKGRPFDLLHVKLLIRDAQTVCKKEKVDDTLLMPLVILHDIGYGVTGPVYFQKNRKKEHMITGSRLAKTILTKVKYPPKKIGKIAYWISVHDNWIFGHRTVYKRNQILAILNDLDFIWMATPEGFKIFTKMFNHGDKMKTLRRILNDEKHTKRPFSNETTRGLFLKYIAGLKKIIK